MLKVFNDHLFYVIMTIVGLKQVAFMKTSIALLLRCKVVSTVLILHVLNVSIFRINDVCYKQWFGCKVKLPVLNSSTAGKVENALRCLV